MTSTRMLSCVRALGLIMLTLLCTPCLFSQATYWRGSLFANYLNRYDGLHETGNNRGAFIDKANRRYAFIGAPYCASGQSMAMDESNASLPERARLQFRKRSGRARDFITSESVDSREIYYGRKGVPAHCFNIYVRTGGGHISFHDNRGRCFHFNSSSGQGSQWNGRWSGWRIDNIKSLCSPLRSFRITHFTPVF